MNKAQRIIITTYVIISFTFWLRTMFKSDCDFSSSQCLILDLIIGPLFIAIIFGIPTFILFKIWKDKK